jgi:hypothetical protein
VGTHADRYIRIVDAHTGELLRELTLDPQRDYQPLRRPPGPRPKTTDCHFCRARFQKSGSSQTRVWSRSESSGVEEAGSDVVGEVAEPECGFAEVLESSVDGLGRSVARAGAVEVGEHLVGSSTQRSPELGQLDEVVTSLHAFWRAVTCPPAGRQRRRGGTRASVESPQR